jgi:arylsulfatase A-like enzyme
VVVATEFGRPPEFDGGGGRGHYSKAFSIALFGGGLKTGQAIGVTDELGKQILDRPVSVPDLHATIYAALGIDPSKELYDGERPVPITDRGQAAAEAF